MDEHEAAALAVLEGMTPIGPDVPQVAAFEAAVLDQIHTREAVHEVPARPAPGDGTRGDVSVMLLQKISLQLDEILSVLRGGTTDG